MKAIIYVRVSTEEQEEKGYSLDAQIEICKKYCEMRGWEVVKVYSEVGSGRDLKNRTKLLKAIDMIKSGVADVLVAWKMDRVTRKQKDFIYISEQLLKQKDGKEFIGLVSVTENIDLTTAIGRAFMNMVVIFAQLEADMISERTKQGLKKAREKGKQIGWKKGKRRIPQWKVEKIIELYRQGATYAEIREKVKVGDGTITRTLRNAGIYIKSFRK